MTETQDKSAEHVYEQLQKARENQDWATVLACLALLRKKNFDWDTLRGKSTR